MTAIIPIPAFADNYIGEPSLRASGRTAQCLVAAAPGRRGGEARSGEPTVRSTIAEECATNPFLRVDEPAVRAAAELHSGRRLADRVAVFAEVRACKNAF
jgi:hydroxyacylglutathione hydrolase-like protein